jgi:phospholipid/cholesterol/gamma-HCH transport system ATP-binding protein
MLFQGGALFDSLPVWRNISFALLQGRKLRGQVLSKKQAKEWAIEKLKQVNLNPSVANLYPSELSGGMQKRVSLARAIACEPEIIFFDEPTTGLDPITSTTINELIRNLVKQLGATALTITHDLNSARSIADRVALLHQGRIFWQGSVAEMDQTNNPYVDQFIHGRATGPMTVMY